MNLVTKTNGQALADKVAKLDKSSVTKALESALNRPVYSTGHNRKMQFRTFISTMVAELLANGETTYVDGQHFAIEDFDDWLSLLKFAFGHLENANQASQTTNAPVATAAVQNIVKVYSGFDTDQI